MNEIEPKVVGVGGVFFKSENPEETKKWYEENLGLPTDQYGIETEKLENTLNDLKLKNTLPKLICTIPVYQNPMGITMSLGRKKSLIKLSEKYQIPIIENESYADFRIDGPNLPPTLMSLDTA